MRPWSDNAHCEKNVIKRMSRCAIQFCIVLGTMRQNSQLNAFEMI